ncbi:hypothetical protein CerSpe_207910 [Prunus speciosa]
MWAYGSIWDASTLATKDGKYKADYMYQPFIGRYNNFKLGGCTDDCPTTTSCRLLSASPSNAMGLSQQQYSAIEYVQWNYLVYDYCQDPKRDHTQTLEC